MLAIRLQHLILLIIAISGVVVWSLGLSIPHWVIVTPFVISLVAYGISHGSADHVIWSAISKRSCRSRDLTRTVVWYLAIMSGYALLWSVSPKAGAIIFLLMTMWHWGSADAYESAKSFSRPMSGFPFAILSMARSVVPLITPLILHRPMYEQVLSSLAGESAAAQIMSALPSPAIAIALLAGSVFVHLSMSVRFQGSVGKESVKAALLVLLFLFTPPIASIGAYFCLWHGVGHQDRLKTWYRRFNVISQTGRKLSYDQFAITGLLLLGVAFIIAFVDPGVVSLANYLILISVLTMPHMIVVWKMDFCELGRGLNRYTLPMAR